MDSCRRDADVVQQARRRSAANAVSVVSRAVLNSRINRALSVLVSLQPIKYTKYSRDANTRIIETRRVTGSTCSDQCSLCAVNKPLGLGFKVSTRV